MARQPFNPDQARGAAPARPDATPPGDLLSVWQITRLIADALEAGLPSTVRVAGELSNCKQPTSGHLYFTLKDDRSELGGVMWRSNAGRLKFKPVDGMEVIATGQISVYERSGRYQLYARALEPRGVGALELAYRQLCARLDAEGLFSATHKRPLPRYPRRVGVITSATGAAVHDIFDTLGRRYPCAEVVFLPVPVQGDDAAPAIAAAIAGLNAPAAPAGIDVLIVGRGGGSVEDLWAFNEEIVARAIHASRIPIISAVGHETDVTIADLVADVRAATPTAAAELAVPQVAEIVEELSFRADHLARGLRRQVERSRETLGWLTRRSWMLRPLQITRGRSELLDRQASQLRYHLQSRWHRAQNDARVAASRLQRHEPRRQLARTSERLLRAELRLQASIERELHRGQQQLTAAVQQLRQLRIDWRARRCGDRLSALRERYLLLIGALLERSQRRTDAVASRLAALSHRRVLARGYSLTRLGGRTLIRSVNEVHAGDRLVTELHDGSIESRVRDTRQPELFD